jgi:hypothetical protein
MHNVPYTRHPGSQKIIAPVRSQFYWHGMEKDIVDYISRCIEFQRVKDEHRHPLGLLQPFPIPEKKWEIITIDFITKLPWTARQHDSIMVVADKLKKSTHFFPINMTHITTNIVEIYTREIARLYGIPKETVSNKYTTFTSNLWRGLFKGFGTNMNFSTTYHPHSHGNIERFNQSIEDILRMYVMG